MCCPSNKVIKSDSNVFYLLKGCTNTSYAALYKQWHRPMSKRFIKLPYSISRATSIDSDCCHLPMVSVLSNEADKSRFQSVLINKHKVSQGNTSCRKIRIIIIPRSKAVKALSSRSRCASQYPAVQSPVDFGKATLQSCPFAAFCWRPEEEKRPWSEISFLSKTSRFAPLILAHKSSALTWLFDNQATLRHHQIWSLLTR